MGRTPLVLLAAGVVLSTAVSAAAQDPFPDGQGKDVTVRICGQCHPAARGAAVRLTRAGWQDVIGKMVTLGAKGTEAELTVSTRLPDRALQGRRAEADQSQHREVDQSRERRRAATEGSRGAHRLSHEARALHRARRPEEGARARLQQDQSPAGSPGLLLTTPACGSVSLCSRLLVSRIRRFRRLQDFSARDLLLAMFAAALKQRTLATPAA